MWLKFAEDYEQKTTKKGEDIVSIETCNPFLNTSVQ